jgi:anti-sigma factor ChrR (cupin superfamily)
MGPAFRTDLSCSANLMASQPPFRTSPFELKDIFHFAAQKDQIAWQPYKKGVDIYRLYGDGVTGPTAALLRYREHGEVPLHEHVGYEHILILSGSQQDENGNYPEGSFVINPPGTRHQVHSDAGCIVLAIYEKPVQFLE